MKVWSEQVLKGDPERLLVCEPCFEPKRMFPCVNWNQSLGGDTRDEDLVISRVFEVPNVKVRYGKVRVELLNKVFVLPIGTTKEVVFWSKTYERVREENWSMFGPMGEARIEKAKNGRVYVWYRKTTLVTSWEESYEDHSEPSGYAIQGMDENEEESYYGKGPIGSEACSGYDKEWSDYR